MLKAACAPYIAELCSKAQELKSQFESPDSIESISTSALGYISNVLLDLRWPQRSPCDEISKAQCLAILECLCSANHIPVKDWSACCRKILRKYPNDQAIGKAIIDFVGSSVRKNIRLQVKDVIQEMLGPRQSTFIPLDNTSYCYLIENISIFMPLLAEEQCMQLVLRSQEKLCNGYDGCNLGFSFALGTCRTYYHDREKKSTDVNDAMLQVIANNIIPFLTVNASNECLLYDLYTTDFDELVKLMETISIYGFLDLSPVQRQWYLAAISALILQLLREEEKRYIYYNEQLFHLEPVAQCWWYGCLWKSLGLECFTLGRNFIMKNGDQDQKAYKVAKVIAGGIQSMVGVSPSSDTLKASILSWIPDLDDIKEDMRNCFVNFALAAITCIHLGQAAGGCTLVPTQDEMCTMLPDSISSVYQACPQFSDKLASIVRACMGDGRAMKERDAIKTIAALHKLGLSTLWKSMVTQPHAARLSAQI